MKRLLALLILVAVCISLIPACGKGVNEPADIELTYSGGAIPYVVAKNRWNGSVYDREDPFKLFIDGGYGIADTMAGDEIYIYFPSMVPDKAKVTCYLLDDHGKVDALNSEPRGVELDFKLKKAYFVIPSESRDGGLDTNGGSGLIGFRITCSWGANECEYAFITNVTGGTPPLANG